MPAERAMIRSEMPAVHTACHIDAPPARVWELLADAQGHEWNPIMRKIRGAFEAGSDLSFEINVGSRWLPIKARVVRADGRELRWEGPEGRFARKLARVSHYFQVQPSGTGTSLVHGETFDGPACAPMVFLTPGIEASYQKMNQALRQRAESA